MKRFLSILTIAMSVLAPMTSFIQPAQADSTAVTGNWTWTDISDQLTTRTNRPIWAVAQANGSWFYTDGQNLWNGGQVYRYDGSTQINITTDVRNAGIDRVDDIVSDGQTILFLQDVVRLDNQFRVVSYQNGTYTNITNNVRNVVQSDEGIGSISGNKGTWYLITTKGRVWNWSINQAAPVRVSLPSNIQSKIDSVNSQAPNHTQWMYSVHGKHQPMNIVVMDDGSWLIRIPTAYSSGASYADGSPNYAPTFSTEWYKVVNGTYTKLPQLYGADLVTFTGKQVLFDLEGIARAYVHHLISYDGSEFRFAEGYAHNYQMTAAWTGSAWLITNPKSDSNIKMVYAFTPSQGDTTYGQDVYSYQNSGIQTRDLFLTSASDNNGRILLGGAVSTLGNAGPSSPLTAKLVMVTEGSIASNATNGSTTVTTGGSFGGDRVHTSTNGPRVTIQGNPSGFRIGSGKEFAYRVTASDNSGIDRIDVYMNGALIKTCNSTVCEYRTTLYTKGQSTRTIPFYTRVTNKNGYSTDTNGSPDILTVDINSSLTADGSVASNTTTSNATASGISSWTWLDPNNINLTLANAVTYYVGANDTNGINKIDIYANGTIVKTCPLYNATGNQQCSFTAYASNYPQGTNVAVNARIVDGSGLESWTSMTTLNRPADTASSNTSLNTSDSTSGIASWTWLDPNTTTLTKDKTVTYYVGANDSNGINKIEIFENGVVSKTCTLGNATGNQQCSLGYWPNNFIAAGTDLAINARITDGSGLTAWTSMTTLTVGSSIASNATNNGVTNTWIWLDPNVTSLNASDSTGFNVGAQDSDGISKIEIVANGNVIKTCSLGNSTASVSCYGGVYGSSYSANSSIFVNAKVTDANGNATWTDSKTLTRNPDASSTNTNSSASTNNPTNTWVSFEEISLSENHDAWAKFTVGAQDADGISKIEIVANGNIVKTCSLGNALGNQQCLYNMNAYTFPSNTEVFINAKVTDAKGIVTWTDSKQVKRNTQSSSTNNSTASNATTDSVSSWDWLDPSVTSLGPNATSSYHVGSWAARGVSSVSIYLDGKVVKSCSYFAATGNLDCAYPLNGSSFQPGTSFFINALVQSAGGAQSWTTGKTISVTSCSGSSCTAANGSSSVNGWVSAASDKDASGYSTGGIISIASAAYDPEGVARIDIYTNGTRLKSCNNTPTCNATATTEFYSSSFSYEAIMTDRLGNAISTGYKTIYKK